MRPFTILQLSDLHRAAKEPFSNEEIISSLLADAARYCRNEPPIATPDAIVVSGDLVQGLRLGDTAYPGALVKQYEIAHDLLVRLADKFLGGDRAKLVMIPGNHDVDFNMARRAMADGKVKKGGIKGVLFSDTPDSPHRWNWDDAKVYTITDTVAYEDRFKYYCDTFSKFYSGLKLAYPLDPSGYSNLFELDDGRIVVAAFNSCHGNDCFNYVGDIPRAEVAKCHLSITNSGKQYRLKMAVWHHDIAGPPKRSDYMDAAVVKLMIDKGFRLGLHGHQHKANAAPDWVYTARKTSMVVVSAGSLCAGAKDVPRGVSREYNVIEIQSCYTKARVHVREAKVDNIFSAGRFIELGDRSYEDVDWPPESESQPVGTGCGGARGLAVVEQAEGLLKSGSPEEAIPLLRANAMSLGRHGRLLLTTALVEARRWQEVESHLASPENAEEASQLMDALLRQKKWGAARARLNDRAIRSLLGEAAVRGYEGKLMAEEALSS